MGLLTREERQQLVELLLQLPGVLVVDTAAQRRPFHDGSTMLGAVLDRILRESGVGREDALFLA